MFLRKKISLDDLLVILETMRQRDLVIKLEDLIRTPQVGTSEAKRKMIQVLW